MNQLEIKDLGEAGLICRLVVSPTTHPLGRSTFGIPDSFTIVWSIVSAVPTKAAPIVKRTGNRQKPRFELSIRKDNTDRSMRNGAARPGQKVVAQSNGTIIVGIQQDQDPSVIAALHGSQLQDTIEFILLTDKAIAMNANWRLNRGRNIFG